MNAMILSHPKQAIRFSPADQESLPDAERVVYLLRTPTVYDRVALDRATSARGGRFHGQLALLDQLAREVGEVMAESEPELREARLAEIAAHREALAAFQGRVRAGDFEAETDDDHQALDAAVKDLGKTGRAVDEIEDQIAARGGRYAGMLADLEVYWTIRGIEAARLLLAGWENIDAPFRRGADGVSDETLAAIPPEHFPAIAQRVQQAARPSEGTAKNSASQSSGGSGPRTSTAARTRPPKAR